MRLKSRFPIAELRSENPIEATALLRASMRSYSPRAAGITPNGEREILLGVAEIPEFAKGVCADIDIPLRDKNSINTLLADFINGKIRDEACI